MTTVEMRAVVIESATRMGRFKDFINSITGRLLIGFGAIVILLLLAGITGWRSMASIPRLGSRR